jgi:hypothetical protein
MSQQPTDRSDDRQEILFPNGNKARLVLTTPKIEAAEILGRLGIERADALILVVGGADELSESIAPRLAQFFSRGVARAAVDAKAVIIDGGTQSGVMRMMGQGVADRGRESILLGVAPSQKVTYPGDQSSYPSQDKAQLDENHSHFVLVESNEWGGETDTLYALARELTKGQAPVVTLLVNGGDVTQGEVLRSVRQGWPIIVVEGSGRLADQIASLWRERSSAIDDPVVAEIIADGDIHIYKISSPVEGLRHLIVRRLKGDTLLRSIWERFSILDANAIYQQKIFGQRQATILALGLLATLLVVLHESSRQWLPQKYLWLDRLFRIAIIIIPISTSILLAATNRFNPGSKWLLLRASAEAIKREIFRYRARAGAYADQATRESTLASRVEDITRRMMRTEVNSSALKPLSELKRETQDTVVPQMFGAQSFDDGLSFLNPDRYIAIRLNDQLNYYKRKTVELEKKLKWLQWSILIIGGLGTLLAAFGYTLWVALTTAAVAALTTYLGYRRVDSTLMKYNQAATDLTNAQAWWMALPAEEQADQRNIDGLVEHTESVLESELDGWVQQMKDALADLRKSPDKSVKE